MIRSSRKTAIFEKTGLRVESALLALAGITLLASLCFPLWRITLDAPQYPEGMGMQIWTRTIVGENPHDLDIINELNHYIGMKKIIPASIPELRFIMPMVVAFSLLCLLLAIRPKIWTSLLLLIGLSAAGGYGMFDFWKWEYDYGHNLNPMAAIKVPGMSYQPPLIGEAKLLNFLSTSWPGMGGYLLFAGGVLIAAAAAVSVWRAKAGKPMAIFSSAYQPFPPLMFFLSLLLIGCGKPGPEPFAWGEDACHFCKMTLVQKGFAAQRINAKGKVFKYDSIECLLGDLKARPPTAGERVFLSDWSRPSDPASAADSSFILKGGSISSPMGSALAAFQSRDSALAYQGRAGGALLGWRELQKL